MIGPVKTSAPVIKGCSKNVIVVKSPGPMFSEALFILKDDAFLEPGSDSKAILRQAKAAAGQLTLPLHRKKTFVGTAMFLSALFGGAVSIMITLFL